MDEPVDVARLRALAQAATPGPWSHREANGGYEQYVYNAIGQAPRKIAWCPNADSRVDAEFIAAANPAAVESLLDQLDRVTEAFTEAMKSNEYFQCVNAGLTADLDETRRLGQQLADALTEEVKADGRGYGPPELDPAVAALQAWRAHTAGPETTP